LERIQEAARFHAPADRRCGDGVGEDHSEEKSPTDQGRFGQQATSSRGGEESHGRRSSQNEGAFGNAGFGGNG